MLMYRNVDLNAVSLKANDCTVRTSIIFFKNSLHNVPIYIIHVLQINAIQKTSHLPNFITA
jgi:hypothetical protein